MQKVNLMRLILSMSSPERKKRKKEQWNPIVSLPYDLVLSCVARVSRLYYPTLSLVSKSFRSLIASPELYKARSVLGHTESCLYVCIQSFSGEGPTWYTLCRRTDKTLIKSSGYVLAKVPIPESPGALFQGLVAVGCNIYNIGGSDLNSMCNGYYSRVTILDCRSHTLSEAPSLRVGLYLLSASVIDRKIYVAGRYKDGNSFEVVAYDPKEGRWDLVGTQMGCLMVSHAYCEIDNVLYSASLGVVRWYDTEVRMWRNLMGLVELPKLTGKSRVRLANYGGKMVVLWEGEVLNFGPWHYRPAKKKILCAEIALERRNSHEIWGKLEWFDHVLTLPRTSHVVKVLAATV